MEEKIINLRNRIKGDFSTQINEIWRKAKSFHEKQKGDNINGREHCLAVERNIGKLIAYNNNYKRLNQTELFLLDVSACLHDIGKTIEDKKYMWNCDHGRISEKLILENYEQLGLELVQAVFVGHIVGVHVSGNVDEIPQEQKALGIEEVNLVKLAVIFKLADMLETTHQRVPPILNAIYYPGGKIPSKWAGRKTISGWIINKAGEIILQAIPQKNTLENLYALKSMMEDEFLKISPYLDKYHYPCKLGELEIDDVLIEKKYEEDKRYHKAVLGMDYYKENDAVFFAGRNKEIEELMGSVFINPITLLIGESGVGKTSLIMAGLFSRIKALGWKCLYTRPLYDIKASMENGLWDNYKEKKLFGKKSLLEIITRVAKESVHRKVLIVLDQFEDVLAWNLKEDLDDLIFAFMHINSKTIVPNVRLLISFREDAFVRLKARVFNKFSRSLPEVVLTNLKKERAKEAMLKALEKAEIGFEGYEEKNQEGLIDIIIDDLEREDNLVYPPDLQMVIDTLNKNVSQDNRIISKRYYLKKLKGTKSIISQYLMDQLKEFGTEREKARKILVYLINSQGNKLQKSLEKLSEETEIKVKKLKQLLDKFIDIRMLRVLGNGKFELIHDYLGKIINKELVKKEDQEINFLEDQLDSFYQAFRINEEPINSPLFMAKLYRNRRKVKIKKEMFPMLLSTCILNHGPGWYWLKDLSRKEIHKMLKKLVYHQDINSDASFMFVRTTDIEDRSEIIEMLTSSNKNARKVACRALKKIACPEDKERVLKLMKDKELREEAAEIFVKIAQPEDKDTIMEMLIAGIEIKFTSKEENKFLKMIEETDFKKINCLINKKELPIRDIVNKAYYKIIKPKNTNEILEMITEDIGNAHVCNTALIEFEKKIDSVEKNISLDYIEYLIEYINKLYKKDKNTRTVGSILAGSLNDDVKETLLSYHSNINHILTAIRCFRKLSEKTSLGKIIDILEVGNNSLVDFIGAEAFGKLAKPEDRDLIYKMLEDTEYNFRWAGLEALKKFVKPCDRELILKLLDDEEEYVRCNALAALSKVVKIEDRKKIFSMSNDKKNNVKIRAIKALEKIAKLKDIKLIIKIFEKENLHSECLDSVRRMSLSLDFSAIKDILIEMLINNEGGIRHIAEEILEEVFRNKKEKILDFLSKKITNTQKEMIFIFETLKTLDERFYISKFL